MMGLPNLSDQAELNSLLADLSKPIHIEALPEDKTKGLIKWTAIIYGLLLIVDFVGAYLYYKGSVGAKQDDFIKLAGVGATLLTGLFSATASFILAYRQSLAAERLEKLRSSLAERNNKTNEVWKAILSRMVSTDIETLKADLAKEVNKVNEEHKNTLVRDIEKLRKDLIADLEVIKSRMSAERTAYDELSNAAYVYYYALSTLERGRFDESKSQVAELGMVAASRHLRSIDSKDEDLWYSIWQKGRAIGELAEKNNDELARKELWKHHCKEFGNLVNEFKEAAAAKHQSPSIQ